MSTKFKQQTKEIMHCFFSDGPFYETDGPENAEEDEGMRIAIRLRELGDHYEETVIQPLIKKLKPEPQNQVSFSDFSSSVESLCKSWVAVSLEVVSEKHLLKATMALALYVKNNCPEIRTEIQQVAITFIGNRLQNWILEQGGWDQVSRL